MKYFYLFVFPILSLLWACSPPKQSEEIVTQTETKENNIVSVSNGKSGQKFQIGKVKGYRLQIYTTLNRIEALKYKTLFQNAFPEVPAYLVYEEPIYKVRVGDYLSKSEAKGFMPTLNKIKELYGAFAIKCMVNYVIRENKDSISGNKTNIETPIEVTWVDSSRQSLDLMTEEVMTKEDIARERELQKEDKEEDKKATHTQERKTDATDRGVKVRGFIPNDSI